MPAAKSHEEHMRLFALLYRATLKTDFDAAEFLADDFYAFQVLDRAFRSDNQELRKVAAHLQMARETAIETINVRALDELEQTKRLSVLEQEDEDGGLEEALAALRSGKKAPEDDGLDAALAALRTSKKVR